MTVLSRPLASPRVARSALLFAALALIAAPAPASARELTEFARAGTLVGIDVSRYQGSPDWVRVRDAGVRFVIARATVTLADGTVRVDPQYATNKAAARALGIPFTAYHYARPNRDLATASAQARAFVKTAQLKGRHLLPVLDLEETGGLGPMRLTRWVRTWLRTVRASLGVKPMIYTSSSFWREKLADTRTFADHGYRLFLAHWTTNDAPSVPAGNWGGRGWTLWQVCDCASVDGISGAVDVDRLNGTSIGFLRIRRNR